MIKLENIKSGDIIVEKGGTRLFVFERNGELHAINFMESRYHPVGQSLERYSAVYRPQTNYDLFRGMARDADLKKVNDFEMIEDDSYVKEVTLEEIAQQFGVNASQIRIKDDE